MEQYATLYNNQLCYQTKFNQTKLQDRIGNGHGSVGVTLRGYKMSAF